MPTKVALSLPLLKWTGGAKKKQHNNERLVGRDKDRDSTHQLMSQAKQTELGEKV